MDHGESEVLGPIKDIAHFRKLMEGEYVLEGPREDASKNMAVFERFLRRGHEFTPEDWLESRGYEFVEPSTFTKGYKLAYRMKEDVTEQYFRSNYSLHKKDRKICLYLKERK
jgi:hypothetical protein